MINKTKSFSVKPNDVEGAEALKSLENYSSRTGVSFSKLIVGAMKLKIRELNINVDGTKQN